MAAVSFEIAKAQLGQIIAGLKPGEEITITDQGQPLAQLRRSDRTSWPCKAGSARDTPHWMAPDFDAPLDGFVGMFKDDPLLKHWKKSMTEYRKEVDKDAAKP